jgi:hypothetical protein
MFRAILGEIPPLAYLKPPPIDPKRIPTSLETTARITMTCSGLHPKRPERNQVTSDNSGTAWRDTRSIGITAVKFSGSTAESSSFTILPETRVSENNPHQEPGGVLQK